MQKVQQVLPERGLAVAPRALRVRQRTGLSVHALRLQVRTQAQPQEALHAPAQPRQA